MPRNPDGEQQHSPGNSGAEGQDLELTPDQSGQAPTSRRKSDRPRSARRSEVRATKPLGGSGAETEMNYIAETRRRDRPSEERDPNAAGRHGADPEESARAQPVRERVYPARLQDELVVVGKRLYFPSGDLAITDYGDRLATPLNNATVTELMMETARARGWESVTIGGSAEFKRAAWMQLSLEGFKVRGHSPTEVERALLVRTIAKERAEGRHRTAPSESSTRSDAVVPERESSLAGRQGAARDDHSVIRGKLLAHGPAPFENDPRKDLNYYMRVQTTQGERTLWGKDFERAVQESLSGVKVGDQVAVQYLGKKEVKVMAPRFDEAGRVIGREEITTHRNHWEVEREWKVEREDFLDARRELASVVRDPNANPREVVRKYPQLAGTMQDVQAAQLLAGRDYADVRDQARFVERVRRSIAEEIERGEPLTPVRVRRAKRDRVDDRDISPMERDIAHTH